MTTQMTALGDLIDLEEFPIDRPGSAGYRALVEHARAGLRSRGCALIKGFVRPQTAVALNEEMAERKHRAHYNDKVMNPYFHSTPDPRLSDDHPLNTFVRRTSAFIPGDAWDETCCMKVLFKTPELAPFLADCLELSELHPYADPLAGLSANICEPGQQLPWHFDTNDFAVTVVGQPADEGGMFEYVPGIRSARDESFERVREVLAGGRDGVHTLDLRPGDLQIFLGRNSLHRVTRVGVESRTRRTAIFSYTRAAGVIGRPERTRQIFGRTLPVHEQAERDRVRTDTLLD